MHNEIIQIAWIAAFSIVAQWLGWRLRIPAIVFFLVFGFIAGPIFKLVHPELLLGDLLQPLTSIAVGIILFEGSLNLNFKEIGKARVAIRHFVLIGGPLAWGLTAASAYYLGGLSMEVAITFGALLIVTGPTVIMPLLRNARLADRPGSILKWEGLINDPIGAVLAVLSYEYFKADSLMDSFSPGEFVSTVGLKIVGIMAASFLFGRLLGYIFNKGYIPEYLKSAALLSFVVITVVICNEILHESGLIAVTVMGITMANMSLTSLEDIKKFKETMTLMLVAGIFIILTAQIDPAILLNIDWRGILFIASILFVIRPVTALVSSIGTQMSWKEVLLTGWIAPRGIVCAAVAGIMGPLLVSAGFEDGAQLLPLAFAIVLITVIVHGLTAKPFAHYLGLSHPSKDYLIIVGASGWALQLAQILQSRDIEVLIADRNWHALKQARLSEIPTYFGEVLSEETEYNLELLKYNTLLAVTNNPAYNSLVCTTYAHDFSREATYQFLPHEEDDIERQQITETMRGMDFGSGDLDFWTVSNLFNNGWRFKATKLGTDDHLENLQARAEGEDLKVIGYIRHSNKLNRKLFLSRPRKLSDLREDDTVIVFGKVDEESQAQDALKKHEERQEKKQEKEKKKEKKKEER